MNFLAALTDVEAIQSFDWRLGLAFRGAEGGEVVLAHQGLRRVMHRFSVQPGADMPDLAIIKGWRAAAVENAINVMPPGGGKAGVKFAVRRHGLQHDNGGGTQKMVEGIAHLAGLEMFLQIEMRHLAIGMHAGIGAARAGDSDARGG